MSDLARALLGDLDPAILDELAELLWPRILTWMEAKAATQPADPPRPLLSAAEAAEHAGVNVETIRRAARRGELTAGRVGRAVRIDPADLSAWLSAGERPSPAPRPRARRSRAGRPLADAMASLERNQTHDRGDTTRGPQKTEEAQ